MSTYAGPRQWNDKARRAADEGDESRSKVAKRGTLFIGNSDAAASHNARQNMDESMAEDADQRVVDQYPAGTKSNGGTSVKSRNKSGYGKPVAYANGGLVTGKSYKK